MKPSRQPVDEDTERGSVVSRAPHDPERFVNQCPVEHFDLGRDERSSALAHDVARVPLGDAACLSFVDAGCNDVARIGFDGLKLERIRSGAKLVRASTRHDARRPLSPTNVLAV